MGSRSLRSRIRLPKEAQTDCTLETLNVSSHTTHHKKNRRFDPFCRDGFQSVPKSRGNTATRIVTRKVDS
jgi:hypothetical protein